MEIIKKPCNEEVIEINDKYVLKKTYHVKGHRCSLQYHKFKRETIYVLSGKLKIYTGKSKNNLTAKTYNPQETITLPPGLIHRMEELKSIYLEASTPELDDVVRISDDYNRKVENELSSNTNR